MVANVFNASTLALGRLRQANLDEFEANLMFLASSHNEIVSPKNKTKQKKGLGTGLFSDMLCKFPNILWIVFLLFG